MKPTQAGGGFAAGSTLQLIALVSTILDADSISRAEAVEEFRRMFDPLIRKLAASFLQALPHFNLDDLVDDAFSFLIMGLHQDAQGEPSVRQSPLQSWLEKQVKGSLHAYVATCAYNYFRDLRRQTHYKSVQRFISLEQQQFTDEGSAGLTGGMNDFEVRWALRTTTLKLPPYQRDILHKFFFEGLTYQQVAHSLGISEARAKALLRQAIDRLRRLFNHSSTRPEL